MLLNHNFQSIIQNHACYQSTDLYNRLYALVDLVNAKIRLHGKLNLDLVVGQLVQIGKFQSMKIWNVTTYPSYKKFIFKICTSRVIQVKVLRLHLLFEFPLCFHYATLMFVSTRLLSSLSFTNEVHYSQIKS